MSRHLGPEAQRLLANARFSSEPTPKDRWVVRRGLAAQVGATSAALTAGAVTSKAAATLLGGVKLSLLAQFGIATVAGATLASSAMMARTYVPRIRDRLAPPVASTLMVRPTPSSAVTKREAEPMPAADGTTHVDEDSVAAAPAVLATASTKDPGARRTALSTRNLAAAPAAASAQDPTPTPSGTTLAPRRRLLDEGRALAEVQRALGERRADDALQLLEIQSEQYAGGALAPERAAARVIALCDAGKRVQARSAAERFAQTWPDSPLLGRVLASCK